MYFVRYYIFCMISNLYCYNQGNKTPSKIPEFSSSSPTYHLPVPTSFDAAANTQKAKELLKSGAIHVSAEKKTTFKRSSNLTRRLLVSNF